MLHVVEGQSQVARHATTYYTAGSSLCRYIFFYPHCTLSIQVWQPQGEGGMAKVLLALLLLVMVVSLFVARNERMFADLNLN